MYLHETAIRLIYQRRSSEKIRVCLEPGQRELLLRNDIVMKLGDTGDFHSKRVMQEERSLVYNAHL